MRMQFSGLAALTLVSVLVSAEALAKVSVLIVSCPITENYRDDAGKARTKVVTAKFALSGVPDARKIGLEYLDQDSADNDIVVQVTPKTTFKEQWSAVTVLNDNWDIRPVYPKKEVTDKETGKKKKVEDRRKAPTGIEIRGDGDGVSYATLGLYKNTDYSKGYFRFTTEEKQYNFNQKLECETEEAEIEELE